MSFLKPLPSHDHLIAVVTYQSRPHSPPPGERGLDGLVAPATRRNGDGSRSGFSKLENEMKIYNPESWGLIPSFLDENDPVMAWAQFSENYIGGWSPMPRWKRIGSMIKYPEDPPMEPLGMIRFRDELLYIYPGSWVMIVQPDDTYEISRMD